MLCPVLLKKSLIEAKVSHVLLQNYLMISFCGVFFGKQEDFVVLLSSNFWSIWIVAFMSSELLFSLDNSELIYEEFFDLFISPPFIFFCYFPLQAFHIPLRIWFRESNKLLKCCCMSLSVLASWSTNFSLSWFVLQCLCSLLSPAGFFIGLTFQLAFPDLLGFKLSSKGELIEIVGSWILMLLSCFFLFLQLFFIKPD